MGGVISTALVERQEKVLLVAKLEQWRYNGSYSFDGSENQNEDNCRPGKSGQ
jgi:hypothetical protein